MASNIGAAGKGANIIVLRSKTPFVTQGKGDGRKALQDQAAVLFCAVTDVKQSACCNLTGDDDKSVERAYGRLNEARMRYVERAEQDIVYGEGERWKDVTLAN